MDHASLTLSRPNRRSFLFWLTVAVMLHGLLLLWPAAYRSTSQAALNTLRVTLARSLRTSTPPEVDNTPAAINQPPAMEALRQATPAGPSQTEPAPTPVPPIRVEPEPTTPPPSAASLYGSAKSLQLPRSMPESPARLGRQRPTLPSPNWRSVLPGDDHRFIGRALPDRVEVLDRWLAADGSHNVLVETPSGDVYCGRADAWDPMQPFVEPVMVFRACGKGRSTFAWPDEFRSRPARAPAERRQAQGAPQDG